MYEFKVWAPLASRVRVEADGAVEEMSGPDEQGWWRAAVSAAKAGTNYGFLLEDDERAYPDPRSYWQPDGVHALSRVYDQNAFRWSDAGFRPVPLASAIVYEMHVGTFTSEGTLDAAIGRLDKLVELGITHVELLPVAAFSGNQGWGYDGVTLFAVHQPYGGPDALKRFVDAAHGKGLAVLMDVVYNHFGPVGNYSGKFGPYVTDEHHTPWGGAVNLEGEGSAEVRRFFCDNAIMWMRDYHMDGLRLDAVHAYVDRSAIHFLEQLQLETEALSAAVGRSLVLIAESDQNDPRLVTAREAGGFGLAAQWSDDFHHALFTAITTEPPGGYYADFAGLEKLKKALEDTFVYDGYYSLYRNRVHGKSARHLPQSRFLGYIQNHDQIGNRAIGDRIHETVGMGRTMIAAALVMTAPFVPMIFQGEEWATSAPFQYFADHDDPEMARLVSEGRKREFAAFGWDPSRVPDPEKRETFERSKLCWDEMGEGDHKRMYDWYRKLIHLRRTTPDLNVAEPGNTRVTCSSKAGWIEMRRGKILVLCNLGETPHDFSIAPETTLLMSSEPEARAEGGRVRVGADGVAIVREA